MAAYIRWGGNAHGTCSDCERVFYAGDIRCAPGQQQAKYWSGVAGVWPKAVSLNAARAARHLKTCKGAASPPVNKPTETNGGPTMTTATEVEDEACGCVTPLRCADCEVCVRCDEHTCIPPKCRACGCECRACGTILPCQDPPPAFDGDDSGDSDGDGIPGCPDCGCTAPEPLSEEGVNEYRRFYAKAEADAAFGYPAGRQ